MSLRGPVLTLTARPEGPSLMGWDGWDGTLVFFVLLFSSYFVRIRYIPTYTYTKKLPPTFLYVLKFDVKLGVG